jgi:integrase
LAKHLLTDRDVRNAKSKLKPYRLADGENLYLFVASSGVRSWQIRYRVDCKQQTSTLGKYPLLSLAAAREKAESARKMIGEGKQLTVEKRVAKDSRNADIANTFEKIGADWIRREARRQAWTPKYRREVEAALRNHLAPLMRLPLTSIKAPIVTPVLRRIEDTAPHMLIKVRPRLHAILDYGVETGAIPGNPLPSPRRGKRLERKHYPAITDLAELGDVLRAARKRSARTGIWRAHLMLAFTAQRIAEVTAATWNEFDLDVGNWTIPRERMKVRRDKGRPAHIVPLPNALLVMLREWRAIDGEDSEYVCRSPTNRGRPVTSTGVEKFYSRDLGLKGRHSPHSWRSAFSSICRDAGKAGDVVEAQLDHIVGNAVQAAYDRATRLELRRELLQWYEEQLIAARDGSTLATTK